MIDDNGHLDALPLTHRLAGSLAVRHALAGEVDIGVIAACDSIGSWVKMLADVGVADHSDGDRFRVRLRPPHPGDLEAIYQAWMSPENRTWRGSGDTFPFHETELRLFSDTDAVLVGEQAGTGTAVSLHCRYGTNAHGRFAYLAHMRLDSSLESGPYAAFEGHVRFIDLAFREQDVRKVMFEVPEPNRWLFDGFVAAADVASIVGHRYVDGAYVDVHHVSLWKDAWRSNTDIWRVAPAHLADELPHWFRRIVSDQTCATAQR